MKNKIFTILDELKNPVIGKAILTTYNKINDINYNKILCSVSGGSDSDIVIDLIEKVNIDKKVNYVFFDTGLEYNATKEHIEFLQSKYNVEIETIRPKIPIPLAVKRYGQPFISKHVSEMIYRLQRHGFKWEDKTFEELYKEYPKCKSALEWWCNIKPSPSHNIKQNKMLKEFLIKNPPTFKISQKCCKYAKKDVLKEKHKEGFDLDISGVRRAEGGLRKVTYKSCFDSNDNYDKFRPIFWFNNEDKLDYKKQFNISNSKCYSVYGLKRTGCCGCPFGREFENELEILKNHEPKLYKAVINIFKDSYEYTIKYNEFKKENKNDN